MMDDRDTFLECEVSCLTAVKKFLSMKSTVELWVVGGQVDNSFLYETEYE